MKTSFQIKKYWLLIFAPLFIQGLCNKDSDDITTPTADQYVTWRINGANGSLEVPKDSIDFNRSGNNTAIYGSTKPNATASSVLAFDGAQQAGTFLATDFGVTSGGKNYTTTSTPIQVNVTTYGTAGQYLIGTYNGNIKEFGTSSTITVTGSFRVKVR